MKMNKKCLTVILIHTAAAAVSALAGVLIYKKGKKDGAKNKSCECDCISEECDEDDGYNSKGNKIRPQACADTIPDISAEMANMPSVENNTLEIFEVYWSKNGNVWHKDKKCILLGNTENAQSGSVQEAVANGKKRPCNYCARDKENA